MALIDRVWPTSLRQYVVRPGYEINFPDAKIEQQMDTGAGQSFIGNPLASLPFQASLHLNDNEAKDLYNFYTDTLKYGSLAFLMKNQFRISTAGVAVVPGAGYSPFDNAVKWWIVKWGNTPPKGIPYGLIFTFNFDLRIVR